MTTKSPSNFTSLISKYGQKFKLHAKVLLIISAATLISYNVYKAGRTIKYYTNHYSMRQSEEIEDYIYQKELETRKIKN